MPRTRKISPGHFAELGSIVIAGVSGERRVRAYVPAGGAGHARPLLFLFDGQNAFGDEGSFAGGWHTHVAIDKQEARRAIAPIVVAIDHGHANRINELGPWRDPRAGGGQTDATIDAIVGQLMPRVHDLWPLHPGPGGHVIGGSSMGGLAALYAHFRRPDAFGGALCMSPSFWFRGRAIFDFVAAQSNPYQSRVYIDCGAREGRGRMTGIAESMADHLRARGWGDGGPLRLMWRPDSKGTHAEKHWRRRLPKALKFFFG